MSEQDRIQDCLRKEIRSLLISTKDGLTPQLLEKEYLLMVGNHLPLRILGYRSTMELVLDMPDVVSVCPCGDGTVILKAIPDESTKGIASLVAKQKSSHKFRNSMPKGRASVCSGTSSSRVPYRGRVAPILPAVVKSELKDLLALSPVLLSDFEKAFAKRFGRSFQYMQYGFLSMFEVLHAASDVISVEQTRAGSLLTLKKSVSEEKHRGWPTGKIFTQPFRMKQRGSYSTGFPVAKPRFSQLTPNTAPPKQILNMGNISTFSAVETSRLNHTEKLNQLENTFKSVIAQIGPGGTLSPELKQKIKFVVSKFPEGLLISKLLGEFEVIFKEQLSPQKLGFLNVSELVGALSDILRVEFKGEQDLLVFDADTKFVPPDQSVSPVRNVYVIQPDKIGVEDYVSSPPRNSLSTAAIKETTWDCSSKKDPEQQICEEPNLMKVEINKSLFNMALENYDIPPDAVQEKKLCRLPPLDTSTLVGVFVEYILSPSQFYIRMYSRDSSELLEDMMIEMRRCYSSQLVSDRYVMPEFFVQPGHLCCVRISEDKWWYRVIVHRVLGENEVEVFYPDFGNIGTVQKSSLRFLKCCYTKLPAQAIPCSLAWVRPVEEHWTSRAILQFQKLCGLKPLVGVVDEYIDGILHIFLCDTSSNEDVYFHHVLREEGHAIVCRENVPSKGFRDLNPLALYTKPSGRPDDLVLTELGDPSQKQHFNEDRERNPQSKETELNYLEPFKDSELNSLKTQKNCEDPQCFVTEPKDLMEENEDEIPSEMPCLESVTIGDDIWDENWLPLQEKVGKEGDAASHLFTSSIDGKKQHSSCEETSQKPSWWVEAVLLDMYISQMMNMFLETCSSIKLQQPGLEGCSDSPSLPKLEEFYISLIQSQQSAEGSQFEPDNIQTQPTQVQLSTAALCSATVVDAPSKHSGSVESSPGSLMNEDFSRSHAVTVFRDKHEEATDQLSLILSSEHKISQKLYIPRSTATAALGAAARLATSGSFLHWYPSVKRMEA
ncbi:tudor domain-containing protein 5 [Ctenodactylus gundi]